MRKIALIALMGLGLVGCNDKPSRVNWSDDCNKNYSLDANELDVCMKRVAAASAGPGGPGSVSLDPANTTRPSIEEIEKSHDRGD